eukprot:36488_1
MKEVVQYLMPQDLQGTNQTYPPRPLGRCSHRSHRHLQTLSQVLPPIPQLRYAGRATMDQHEKQLSSHCEYLLNVKQFYAAVFGIVEEWDYCDVYFLIATR